MQEPTSERQFAIVGWLARRPRWQVVVAAVVVLAYAAWRVVRFAARQVLDRWWFDSVTDAPIWSAVITAKLQLIIGSGLVTVLVLGGSAVSAIVVRSADGTLPAGLARRYRGRMGPAHRWLMIAVVMVITVKIISAAAGQWQDWVLFRHGARVGTDVPDLGRDLGYYLFDLPFLSTLSAWLRSLLVASFLIAFFGYSISGALRLPMQGRRSRRRALAHLSVLAAAFAAVEVFDYLFVRRPSLAVGKRGAFVGPGYTDVTVTNPAISFLALVAVAFIAAIVVGIVRRGWRWPAGVLAGWAIVHVLMLMVVPSFVQNTFVGSADGSRELPYLARNLAATRTAFQLDNVEEGTLTLDRDADVDAEAAFGQVPLFDTARLPGALQVLAGTTGTRITDVDLDRYDTASGRESVFVATRDASRGDLPESGWTQQHLVYTHGNGVVMLPAAETEADGRPATNALNELLPERSELYFGQGLANWYAIVGTDRAEQGGGTFSADTGVSMSSFGQRLVLGLATGEYQPVLSNEFTSNSQLLYRRDIRERLGTLAPFLTVDSDPYPVVTDGRVVWVADAYTTSTTYPYSQFAPLGGRLVNYAHASIKVTMDAYDGSVHLYRTEAGQHDPILRAWMEIFPGLVEPFENLPDGLRSHLLYPGDLLDIQAGLIGRYHVDEPELLYSGTERWSPAAAATPGVGLDSVGRAQAVTSMLPPDEGEQSGRFVAQVPMSPGSASSSSSARDVLAAILVADHDEPDRLQLLRVDSTSATEAATPAVAQSAIDADPELAADFTLRNANGSTVAFGPMTPIVNGHRLTWVRSVIVNSVTGTVVPRVYGLVAVIGGSVGFGTDVVEAIDDATARREVDQAPTP